MLTHIHPCTTSSLPSNPLTHQSPLSFTFFPSPSPFHKTRFLIRSSASDSQTLPKSAIQRIAHKLRSLGFTEDPTTPSPNPSQNAGEIFIPLPHQLPKHRVGHTLDTSWSTPENPVPVPGTGFAISRYHDLRREVIKQKVMEKKEKEGAKREEKAPTLAELSLSEAELRRLRRMGIELRKKLKVGKAGITEGIVNGIHERWRHSEVVKVVCEDLCRMNMKRTHELLERKTGGLVVWRSGSGDKILTNDTLTDALPDACIDDGGHNKLESCSSSIIGVKSAATSPTKEISQPKIVQGVGMPNRVRFQPPGEAQLAEEADRLLEGLGPRFTDWWGYEPLPVDADLLPAIVPGYRKPFRLLPYGVKPILTNDEMTILKRLGRPLPCHFAFSRNRNLQGLAASIVKLWEKCEIAKIAVKRGVQNTNCEMMAEELKYIDSMHPGPLVLSVLTRQYCHRSTAIWNGLLVEQLLHCRRRSKVLLRGPQPHPRVVSYIQRAGLYGLYALGFIRIDWALITALVKRWRRETHTFHMPHGEMTITLQDVEVLLGLPVDGRP